MTGDDALRWPTAVSGLATAACVAGVARLLSLGGRLRERAERLAKGGGP